MLRKLLPNQYDLTQPDLESDIFQSLKNIEQKTIDESWAEIRNLRTQLETKDQVIASLQAKVAENHRNIEGNRQLINKLLSDLSRLRQDIDWYKRTYESRSFFGTIKQKLFGKF
jgi:peptidoglycan hydrolase CwlO-like protein